MLPDRSHLDEKQNEQKKRGTIVMIIMEVLAEPSAGYTIRRKRA